MQLDLDNETERKAAFKILWKGTAERKAVYKSRGPKIEAEVIYMQITSKEGYISTSPGCNGVTLQAPPEDILEAYSAYMWQQRETDPQYIKHLVRFLRQGFWLSMDNVIEERKAFNARVADHNKNGDRMANARNATEERHERERQVKFARFDAMIENGDVG